LNPEPQTWPLLFARQPTDFDSSETYDLVWSFGVIHHSPSPEKILQQIRRYMAPHSRLKLMVYAKISFKLFWIREPCLLFRNTMPFPILPLPHQLPLCIKLSLPLDARRNHDDGSTIQSSLPWRLYPWCVSSDLI
jgi:SAM-dependent methyltransferase